MTKRPGITEVSRQTTKMIREAAAGEQIIITDRDHSIAMLVPIPWTGNPYVDKGLDNGTITPAQHHDLGLVLAAMRDAPEGWDSTEIISQMREERL